MNRLMHLFREACKSLSFSHTHPSTVLDSGLSKVGGTVNLNNRVLANTSICVPASDNYHETNPNSSQTKEESKFINKKKKEPEAALLRKFEAWSKKYRGTYTTEKDEPYWFRLFKHSYKSMNNRKILPPEKLEREADLWIKFKTWTKKYQRTYSSKEDKLYMFMVFKANYESMNDKKILPPKKLVMPIAGHFYRGIVPKNFDQNSPSAQLHKRGQWPK